MSWLRKRRGKTAVVDITHLIAEADRPETQTGKITLSRTGDMVTLSLDDVSFARTAWTLVLSTRPGIPAGFRPREDVKTMVAVGTGDLSVWEQQSLIVRAYSNLSVRTRAGMLHRATVTYPTDEGMPS